MAAFRIIIADDHPLFRDALRQALTHGRRDLRIEGAGTLTEVTALLDAGESYDLVLLDLKMPGVQGFSGLIYLRAQYPEIPVAVVSASEQPEVIRRALDLGASGFIPKTTEVGAIRSAVASVLHGEVWAPEGIDLTAGRDKEADEIAGRIATLTPQQVRVLMMLREGLLNKQIAYQLGVSEATVKAHVSAILQKLNVESRTQAVISASRIDGEQLAGQP
jgi:DNA-binding NarL/FixJ family response regulator